MKIYKDAYGLRYEIIFGAIAIIGFLVMSFDSEAVKSADSACNHTQVTISNTKHEASREVACKAAISKPNIAEVTVNR